jgi:hypothetical protein
MRVIYALFSAYQYILRILCGEYTRYSPHVRFESQFTQLAVL